MIRKLIIATALFVAPAFAHSNPVPLTPQQQKAVTAAVSKRLTDPWSAVFRFPPWNEGMEYCGFVNAKNQFGGYVGFMPFRVWIFVNGRVECGEFCFAEDYGGNEKRQFQQIIQDCQKAGYFGNLKNE